MSVPDVYSCMCPDQGCIDNSGKCFPANPSCENSGGVWIEERSECLLPENMEKYKLR